MNKKSLVAAMLAVSFFATCAPVWGHAEYQREFLKLYTKGPDVDKDFRKLARKAKCNLCHQGKEDRTNYNRYGVALLDHLSDGDKKDKKKAIAALKAVAETPTDGPDSPTYGDLLNDNQLPGGPLEESVKEPEAGEPPS